MWSSGNPRRVGKRAESELLVPFRIATATASPRSTSDDRLVVLPRMGGVVIVVADGAGGMGGGGRAADLGVKTIRAAVMAGSLDGLSSEACAALLRIADALVTEEREAGETTLVLVVVTAEGRVVGASCGDSGALIVTEGRLDDVTEGQSRWRLGSGRAEPVGFERPARVVASLHRRGRRRRPKSVRGTVRTSFGIRTRRA